VDGRLGVGNTSTVRSGARMGRAELLREIQKMRFLNRTHIALPDCAAMRPDRLPWVERGSQGSAGSACPISCGAWDTGISLERQYHEIFHTSAIRSYMALATAFRSISSTCHIAEVIAPDKRPKIGQ
jgi:hypothetical protein